MTWTFTESGWRFEFDTADWPAVLQWDAEPTYFAQSRLPGTRAVDFCAVGPKQRPVLIEIKHFRDPTSTDPVKERAAQIAEKVRDSLAGVAFAKVVVGDIPSPELAVVRARLKSNASVTVLVIVEYPHAPSSVIALRNELKRLLVWLRGTVAVVGSDAAGIPGLAIAPEAP